MVGFAALAPERRDVDDDKPGVARKVVVADPIMTVAGGPYEDIRVGDELRQRPACRVHRAFAGGEVAEGDAAIAPGTGAEERSHAAQGMAGGAFHDDDVGPEVGEQPSGVRAGDRVATFEDPHTVQRADGGAWIAHVGSSALRPSARRVSGARWTS